MLNKWIPLRRERLGQEIDRAFDRIWQEGRRGLTEYPSSLEVGEEDDRYILRIDVRGMSRDDLLVYLEGDVLIIEGEHKEEVQRRRRGSEVYYGRIYRTIPVPSDTKPKEIQTRLRRGVLEVTVPRERQAGRRIEVTECRVRVGPGMPSRHPESSARRNR